MEEEFVSYQKKFVDREKTAEEEQTKLDDIRGTPLAVHNLDEIIDDNHAIISSSSGPEYYVSVWMQAPSVCVVLLKFP